jgi:hypothetical protein
VGFSFVSVQHWIRLELFPDVLVHRLKLVVDPADSSYMPSLVVVSGREDNSLVAGLSNSQP